MKLQRKSYSTRKQKIGDLAIGIGLWHAINIGLVILFIVASSMLGGFFEGIMTGNSAIWTQLGGLATTLLGCLPFLLNIGTMIYFGLTRYWIALGMLASFAFWFLLSICLALVFGAVCFAAMSGATLPGQ
jgi:hypothetical protein